MTDKLLDILVAVILSTIASSGFWMFVMKKTESKSLLTELVIGLAHDRIVYLSMTYIDKGWVCKEEYENLVEYLYKPYQSLGGNGSAKRLIGEVEKLPIRLNRDVRLPEKTKNETTE
jgi:hypothetical protein